MNRHFSVIVSPRALANAAAFLQKSGARLRSRNQLVSLCISYLEETSVQEGTAVATSDEEGEKFLLREGLGGNVEKSWEGKALPINYTFLAREAEEARKLSRKNGNKVELPVVTEEDVISSARRSADEGETLEQFHEFALAAFGSKVLESEALREKVSKLFEKI